MEKCQKGAFAPKVLVLFVSVILFQALIYPQSDGLLAYWKFDEDIGIIVYDSSGNDLQGSIYGAAWDDGKIGSERVHSIPPHDVAINCFNGSIDEVKIFNRALSSSEIQQYYDDIVLDISKFAIFATNSIYLKSGAQVLSGNIGTLVATPGPWLAKNSEVTIGQNVYTIDDSSIYGDTVTIKSGASVCDVHYNELNNNGTIRCNSFSPIELPLDIVFPEFPTPEPGTVDIDIPVNGTLTLNPGSYGEVIVKSDATLVLTGGTYHLENLALGDNHSEILIQGKTDIIINNRLEPGTNGYIGPDEGSGVSAKDIIIFVNGINGSTGKLGATPKAATIGISNTIEANVYVPNGTIRIRENTIAEGAFFGKDVILGLNTHLTLNSAFDTGQPYFDDFTSFNQDEWTVIPDNTGYYWVEDGLIKLHTGHHGGVAIFSNHGYNLSQTRIIMTVRMQSNFNYILGNYFRFGLWGGIDGWHFHHHIIELNRLHAPIYGPNLDNFNQYRLVCRLVDTYTYSSPITANFTDFVDITFECTSSEVKIYVDGTFKTSISTNITTETVYPCFSVHNADQYGDKSMYLDWIIVEPIPY